MNTERKIDFPAVTICNMNPIDDEEKVRNHEVYGAFIKVQEKNPEARKFIVFLDNPGKSVITF